MDRSREKKVPGGKLVRVRTERKDGKIVSVRIEGDFFVHPEEGLEKMERSLVGLRTEDVETMRAVLNRTVEDYGIILIGFTVDDLTELLGDG
ncbi:MAG: hypothetical protein HPY73_00350 [Methanomassiliicoccales archaeon]|nr:MAG: hypothetical protein HPY73_00350 [Methanomassiliicoccales archaeon]